MSSAKTRAQPAPHRAPAAAKRVIVICNDGDYFLRHRRIVADALAAHGHRVEVVTGGVPIPEASTRGWRYLHATIERFAFSPRSDPKLLLATVKTILAAKPDALHLITLKPAVICGLAALLTRRMIGRPARIVITIPGLGRLMSPGSTLRGMGAKLARSLVERTIRRLSAQRGVYFTFETQHDRSHWLRQGLIRPDNSVVISGAGVDPALFYPAEQRPTAGRVRVLFASRLLKTKGLDAFLETARSLSGRPDVEFLVAGMVEPYDPDGYSPDELRVEPAITFLGEVSEMAELLRGVDIVCLPSRYGEGIPRILIEAAACGIASIASDLDGCQEIVDDGISGMIVPAAPPARTAAAVEAAVRCYLDDRTLLARHGQAARERFLAGEFSEEAVVEHFLQLITGGA